MLAQVLVASNPAVFATPPAMAGRAWSSKRLPAVAVGVLTSARGVLRVAPSGRRLLSTPTSRGVRGRQHSIISDIRRVRPSLPGVRGKQVRRVHMVIQQLAFRPQPRTRVALQSNGV